jgi:asparagine synthase (glutamine-hydrolysing)
MCGIVGILDTRGEREISHTVLSSMNESQHHRGPDGGGLFEDPGIGLGHRRLAIIDVSSGQQPLFNEDESVVVVFNGEIYNFQALTDELEAAGHQFRTRSDTEVIVHAWEEWGERCVEQFRGMFGIAIWDRNTETLFLARDRLGIKPLYYAYLPNGFLIFGSELKSLLVHPDMPRELEPTAVEEFFAFGYVPDPGTILRHARKLPAGHSLRQRRGSPPAESREYWDLSFGANPAYGSEQELREELIGRLRDTIELHMISEVPLGAFLSGGVDSSGVVSLMAGLSSQPVKTCSISFGDPAFNEAQFAESVARTYRTDHRTEQVDPEDFSLLEQLAGIYDEPFADSSSIPTYRVCQLARKHVTVALSGDGGDENFGGYRRYRWHLYEERVRQVLPQGLRGPVFGLLGGYYPKLDWAPKMLRAKTTFQALARDTLEAYLNSVSIFPQELRDRLFSRAFRGQLQGHRAIDVFKYHAARSPVDEPLGLIQYLDYKTYLPGDILTKVDRASMVHALEVRVPILDHEFVEWVSGIGSKEKIRGREGKWIFKRALEPHLPTEVLYRPKMGFSVPLASWFRGPLKSEIRRSLTGEGFRDHAMFDHTFVERLVSQHESGSRDHSAILWALLMFDRAYKRLFCAA